MSVAFSNEVKMQKKYSFEAYNKFYLERMSFFLNECPDIITRDMVEKTASDCMCSFEQAYRILLAGSLDLFGDKTMIELYIGESVKKADIEKYASDEYLKLIKLDRLKYDMWEIKMLSYKPYELFPCGDLVTYPDGRVLPRLGFFDREYEYPCILESGREWMLITPNEIETMRSPISQCFGKVLTYGLGLGYFVFHASNKFCVESITVVEKDERVIDIFRKHILPQFPHSEKIKVVCDDALHFAAKKSDGYDFVFADIWHDPTDGCELYLILKMLEKSGAKYAYWIEDTIKYYL